MSERRRQSRYPMPRTALIAGEISTQAVTVSQLRRAIVQARERRGRLEAEVASLREVADGLEASESALSHRADRLTEDCEALEERLERARERARELGGDCRELEADNASLESGIEAIGRRSGRLAEKITALEEELNARSEKLQEAHAGLRRSVGSVARMNFQMGKKVRGAEDPPREPALLQAEGAKDGLLAPEIPVGNAAESGTAPETRAREKGEDDVYNDAR